MFCIWPFIWGENCWKKSPHIYVTDIFSWLKVYQDHQDCLFWPLCPLCLRTHALPFHSIEFSELFVWNNFVHKFLNSEKCWKQTILSYKIFAIKVSLSRFKLSYQTVQKLRNRSIVLWTRPIPQVSWGPYQRQQGKQHIQYRM